MSLAKEYVDSSVGVYALNPGMMKTDLLTRVDIVAGYEHKLDAFPIVIQMLSKPPAIPAQKAVWLASTKTDGRTGIIVRESSWIDMLIGAVREGVRRLLRRPTSQVKVALRSVPSALRIED